MRYHCFEYASYHECKYCINWVFAGRAQSQLTVLSLEQYHPRLVKIQTDINDFPGYYTWMSSNITAYYKQSGGSASTLLLVRKFERTPDVVATKRVLTVSI